MGGPREQIGRDKRFVTVRVAKWIKRMFSKWRRRQERRYLEDAPKRNSYKGWWA